MFSGTADGSCCMQSGFALRCSPCSTRQQAKQREKAVSQTACSSEAR